MAKEKAEENHGHCCCCGGKRYFWGVFFLIVGLIFMAQDLGYIVGVGFFTVLFLLLGIFLLIIPKK